MRQGNPAAFAMSGIGYGIQTFLRRQFLRALGLALLAFCGFAVAGLKPWNVADPSFSHATANEVTNAMGYPGAVFSDLAMQFFGLAAVAGLLPAFSWSLFLLAARRLDRLPRRGLAWFGALSLSAGITGCIAAPDTWPLPSGLGGVVGDIVLKLPGALAGGYPTGWIAALCAAILVAPTVWLMLFATGLIGRIPVSEDGVTSERDEIDDAQQDPEESSGVLALGAVVHWWLSLRAFVRRTFAAARPVPRAAYDRDEPEDDPLLDLEVSRDDRLTPVAPSSPRTARIEPRGSRP